MPARLRLADHLTTDCASIRSVGRLRLIILTRSSGRPPSFLIHSELQISWCLDPTYKYLRFTHHSFCGSVESAVSDHRQRKVEHR